MGTILERNMTTVEQAHHAATPGRTKKKKKLFISYSWSFRADLVRFMAKYLKKLNFKVWIDVEEMYGDSRQQVFEAIDAADLVLVFFSQPYSRLGSNSMKELRYTIEEKKPMLLVRLQKNYQPVGQFLQMVSGLPWIDYDNHSDISTIGLDLSRKIQKLLPDLDDSFAAEQATFETVNVPLVAGDYLKRSELESRIRTALISVCSSPDKGAMAVVGDSGIGKTTLLARLLQMKPSDNDIKLSRSFTVFWINCSRWRENFDDVDKKEFDSFLVTMATETDPTFFGTSTKAIVSHFRERNNKQILFVLDDVLNAALLQHFFDNALSSPSPCCLITKNAAFLENIKISQIVEQEALSQKSVQLILEDICQLKDKLSPEQIDKLAGICNGLPLIAYLIRGFFNKDSWKPKPQVEVKVVKPMLPCGLPILIPMHRPEVSTEQDQSEIKTSSTEIYDELTSNMEKLPIGDSGDDEKSRIIYRLFELIMNSFQDPTMYHWYYSFLFFDPGAAVSEKDLRLFLDPSTSSELLTKLADAFLIKQVSVPQNKETHFLVHELLFEAALKKAVEEFKLEGNSEDTLQQVRRKVASGELTSREMILFQAVRQQRLALCRRFVIVMSAENLSRLCLLQQKEQSIIFLLFLYRSTWPDFDTQYSDDLAEAWRVNTSYRLLASILLKLQTEGKLVDTFHEVSDVTSKIGHRLVEFLTDIFDDEFKQPDQYERRPIVRLLNQWRKVYNEANWRPRMISRTWFSVMQSIVRNDDAAFFKICERYQERQKQQAEEKTKKKPPQKKTTKNVKIVQPKPLKRKPQFSAKRTSLTKTASYAKAIAKSKHAVIGNFFTWALFAATRWGRLKMVTALCDLGVKVENCRNEKGETALMRACQFGHQEVALFLAERDGKSILLARNDGRTAMILACENGHLDVVQFLTTKSEKLVVQTADDGLTPMMAAASNGHLEVVQLLAEKNVRQICQADKEGRTPVMFACQYGHLEVVKFLAGRDVKSLFQATNDGRTPTMFACKNGHLPVVKFLVEKNIRSLTQADKNAWTPLMYACQHGHIEVAKFLVEKDLTLVSILGKSDVSPLMVASAHGHLAVAEHLAEMDSKLISHATSDGKTALMMASEYGFLDVVRLLASKDPSSISQAKLTGWTPLMFASAKGHIDVVDILSEIDPNAVSHEGGELRMTPLMVASANGHLNIVKFLASKNPTPDTSDFWNASTFALKNRNFEIVNFLTEKDNKSKSISQLKIKRWATTILNASEYGPLWILTHLVEKDLISIPEIKTELKKAMLLACKNGHLDIVRLLTEMEFRILSDFCDQRWTPMTLACAYGHLNVASFIFEHDPDSTSRPNEFGLTPMHLASRNGQVEVVRFLIAKNPQVASLGDTHKCTPLMLACERNHQTTARYLISTDLNTVIQMRSSDECTAMMLAAAKGYQETVKFVADKDSRLISQAKTDGTTAMMIASQSGHLKVVEYFYEKEKALATKPRNDGMTPLMFAVKNGHLDVVAFLREKDGGPNSGLAVVAACERGNIAELKFLLDKDPKSISEARFDGWTTMTRACANGHLEIVKCLAKKDPDLASRADENGSTPIQCACENGYIDVVRFLVNEMHAKFVPQTNKSGLSMLMTASKDGHEEVVQVLISKDPDVVFLADKTGMTALMHACENGRLSIVKLLAPLDAKSLSTARNDGCTALMMACSKGHLDVVEFLAEMDRKLITQANRANGMTAIMYACQSGHLSVVKILAEKDPESLSQTSKDGWNASEFARRGSHSSLLNFLEAELAAPPVSQRQRPSLTQQKKVVFTAAASEQQKPNVISYPQKKLAATPMLHAVANGNVDLL